MRTSNRSSSRRRFLQTVVTASATAAVYPALGAAREITPATAEPQSGVKSFELDEITIDQLQDGMKSGKFTARSLVEKYSSRIAEIDKQGPAINTVIELNPDAVGIANALDEERKAKGPRGPLHGIPVLIKDNIDTADGMMTTAGSLALVGSKPPKDSMVALKLRGAGAVILGKTNLSEWANIRSSHSTSGWSGRGGLTKNPYALDRNPCGSSSGTGAAFPQISPPSESAPRRTVPLSVRRRPMDWQVSSRPSGLSAAPESSPFPTARTAPAPCAVQFAMPPYCSVP